MSLWHDRKPLRTVVACGALALAAASGGSALGAASPATARGPSPGGTDPQANPVTLTTVKRLSQAKGPQAGGDTLIIKGRNLAVWDPDALPVTAGSGAAGRVPAGTGASAVTTAPAPAGVAAAPDASTALRRVSVATGGGQGDDVSDQAAVSTDGRYIAFASLATDLVGGDSNGVSDIFLHDSEDATTTRISVSGTGTQADASSSSPSMSSNGRYVVFASTASNLVPGDTNGVGDVFLHDTHDGSTTRVSVTHSGTQADGGSNLPAVSTNGRYVVFASTASNLVPGDTNGVSDVFVRDTFQETTTRLSVASDGTQADGPSDTPVMSANGHDVAFASTASNLVPGDTNGVSDVFARDLVKDTTARASVASDGTQADGGSTAPAISTNGKELAFASTASNLVPGDTNNARDVFVHDLSKDTTARVSVSSGGVQANGANSDPSLSADGRYVAFTSLASNLVGGDVVGTPDVLLRDTGTGTTIRVSVTQDGTPADDHSFASTLSADARYVLFTSNASNLVPGDTNAVPDVFVRDRSVTVPTDPPTTTTTPTGPTDPTTGPTDPTTEPTGSTGPTDPTEPTDPTGPTDPTEPTDPTGTVSPTTEPTLPDPGLWVPRTVRFGRTTVPPAQVTGLSAHALKVVTPAMAPGDDSGKTTSRVIVLVGDALKGPRYTYVATGVTVVATDDAASEGVCRPTSEDVTEGGSPNTPVTLRGTNFSPSFTSLLLGGRPVESARIASDGASLTFTPPKQVGGVQDLVVRDRRDGAHHAGYCAYRGVRPTVTGVDRTTASTKDATPILLTGTNLDRVRSATFNGERAGVKPVVDAGGAVDPTRLTVKIPKGAPGTGPLVLTTAYGESARSAPITRQAPTG